MPGKGAEQQAQCGETDRVLPVLSTCTVLLSTAPISLHFNTDLSLCLHPFKRPLLLSTEVLLPEL